MLNLNDLYYFVQVVDHGGFTAASRQSGVPKSTLAKRVTALEADLNVRLIQRTSRRFAVTELGQDFYRHAAAMLIEAEAAEQVVKGRLAEPSGAVRITASVPTAQLALAEPILEVARLHPKIQVVVHATDRFVDIVQEGFDIALRDHFGPLPDSGLVQRPVGRDEVLLVAAPDYLARHGTPLEPADLARHDGLMTRFSSTSWRLHSATEGQVEVFPRPRMSLDESSLLVKAATAGYGITCLPGRMCREALASGALIRVLPEWTAGVVTTTLLTPHRRGQLPAVRVVADTIARYL